MSWLFYSLFFIDGILSFFFARCCYISMLFFLEQQLNKCIFEWIEKWLNPKIKYIKIQSIRPIKRVLNSFDQKVHNKTLIWFVLSSFFHMYLDPLNVMLSVVNVHKLMFRIYFWWSHWDQSLWRAKIMFWWKVDAFVNRNMPQKP